MSVWHRDRASVADGEGDPRHAGKRASRLGKDLGRAIGDSQVQRTTLAIGPGHQAERDIAAAGGQIEDLDRAVAGDIAEQSWQVTQHGRDTAGETVDGADVPEIGRELGRIMARPIEQLLGLNTVGQTSAPPCPHLAPSAVV